ncbi:hypothetical protein H0H87_009082, partial [Tephrocybe sp. NHM501043]
KMNVESNPARKRGRPKGSTCRKIFNLSFDQMLLRNPRFIARRCPRHVPPPSILVPAIQHVFDTFGPALDAKTGTPLFSKQAWAKENAVIELAQEGYLSDIEGISMYKKTGIDKYGLEKFKLLRGTNNVEGGPHGDIYRKFGALNGMNQALFSAFSMHLYGVDWDYHHDIGLIKRTSFLLNYLSDLLESADSYSDWINGDLYEATDETFGICKIPGV